MNIVIHTSPRPLLIRILSTRYFMALTNQVCRIGLILINIYLSLNIMKKTEIIISTIHKVSGDTTPPSHIINNLTNIYLHILLFWTTNKKTNKPGKEDGSIRRARVVNSKSRRLKIPLKISNSRSLLHFSSPTTRRRTYWLKKKYGINDSSPKIISSIG